MKDAAAGTGTGAKAFQQLGISVKGADGNLKSATEIMGEIGNRFATMPDGAEKTALAMELMGRSGADLIPLLNGGAAGLKALTDEADAFGLTISAETGRAAEAFNDNLARVGYAATGVATSLAAALLPAMVVVSEALVAMARGLVEMLAYLPTVAEYAAVAGSALAIMISPQIIASIYAAATALGTALVGALQAVALAAAANPLGALVVGITIAVTAAYHFRDEIQQAIGVDVVGIVKGAANTVANAFTLAYENIKATWSALPTLMGEIVTDVVNAVIAGIEYMINDTKRRINELTSLANSVTALVPGGDGLQIAPIGPTELGRYGGQGPGAYAALQETMGANAKSIMGRDLFSGSVGVGEDAMRSASDAAAGLTAALNSVSTAAGGEAGGGSGLAGAGKKAADAWKGLRKETDASKASLSELGNVGQSIGRTIGSAFKGLIDGSKGVKDALTDVLSSLSDMLINSAFQSLFSPAGGAGGGGLGGILSSIFGGFRAAGGPVSSSKSYIVGERGPELFSPGRSGSIIANDNLGAASGKQTIELNLRMDTGLVAEIADNQIQTRAGEIVKVSVKTMQDNFKTVQGEAARRGQVRR
ncbi:hypothetical protein [Aurantimonas endophytica]|uniref:Uncharacterized protein n=1 Tax=Aurantimonas endophytica TaxID=1522175 RepID=A0A7W6HAG6_9HYPH|nr:hypothetical protein [Aurantimonas endophytica]MBB4001596.1 hypothetical protein [Aurantimonas endophytica]MCO6402765.1 hypothetical protein [Aurantimonas endophytica]